MDWTSEPATRRATARWHNQTKGWKLPTPWGTSLYSAYLAEKVPQSTNQHTHSTRFFGGSILDCIGSERAGGGCTGSWKKLRALVTPHAPPYAYNAPPRRHHHRQSQVTLSAPDGVRVVHEDASYFFVEKPGGLCVAGDVDSGVESFHEQVKRHTLRYGSYQPGLLHRLDRGTTVG